MLKRLAILFVLVLPMALVAQTVVYIGDSISEGHNVAHGQLHTGSGTCSLGLANQTGVPAYWMAAKLPLATLINNGIGSQSSTDVLARWGRDVLRDGSNPGDCAGAGPTIPVKADIVILHVGVNDFGSGITSATTISNLSYMISSAASNGIKLMVDNIGPGTDATFTSTVNTWLASNCTGTCTVLDYKTWATNHCYGAGGTCVATGQTAYISSDNLHPTSSGYQNWVQSNQFTTGVAAGYWATTSVSCGDGGAGLQAAITGASCGSTIAVQSGCSYSSASGFTVANKSCTAGSPLIIQSADMASLPAAGRRIDDTNYTTYQPHMPKLVVTTGGPDVMAINNPYTELRGFELTNSITTGTTNRYVFVNANNVTVDRNYGHCQEMPFAADGTPAAGPNGKWETVCAGSGISVAAVSGTVITGNYIAAYGLQPGTFSDYSAQTITLSGSATNGTITNNDIELGWAGIFSGGDTPVVVSQGTIDGTTPPTLGSADPCQTTPVMTCGQLTLTAPPTTPGFPTAMTVGQSIAIQLPWNINYCHHPLPTSDCWGEAWVTNISGSVVTYTGIRYLVPGVGGALHFLSADYPSVVPSGRVIWDSTNTDNWTITQNKFQAATGYERYWKTNNASHGQCKGYFEFKTLTNSLIQGNYFDGWPCIAAFNPVSQYGDAIKVQVSNVTFDSNWIHETADAWGMGFSEENNVPAGNTADNIVYSNNVVEGFINDQFTDPIFGMELQLSHTVQGTAHLTLSHNTLLMGLNTPAHSCNGLGTPWINSNGDCYSKNMGMYTNYNTNHFPAMNLTVRDNLFGIGNYGFQCESSTFPSTFPNCTTPLTSFTEHHNMSVNNAQSTADSILTAGSDLKVKSWYNESATGLGASGNSARLANPTGGDYRMCTGAGVPNASCPGASVGHNAASDGTDIGANITTVNSYLGPDNPKLPGGSSSFYFSGVKVGGIQ